MNRLWVRLRAALETGVRQQVTRTGLLFTLTIVLIALAAFASANNLLFLILAAMLSTLLVSGFISRLSLAGLELDLKLPEHISARRKVAARIAIRNAKRWMPSFSIHLTGSSSSGLSSTIYFPTIPGGSALEESVDLYFARRGSQRDNSFRFTTRFPFGFTERRAQVILRREVLVYPSIDPQPGFEELWTALSGEIQAHYRGRGHDFYRIRPYNALESARHVDWKATAHTGELQVREFAREQEPMVVIFLDIALPQDPVPNNFEAWFEKAVDCCAFLSWVIGQRGHRVRLQTQNFDLRLPEEGDVYTILKYLALVAPARATPPAAPDDWKSFQIVLTADPARMAELGWGSHMPNGARMLGMDAFPLPADGPDESNKSAGSTGH